MVGAVLPLCPSIALPFTRKLLVLLFQSLDLHRSLQEETGASTGYEDAKQMKQFRLHTGKLAIANNRCTT